MIRGGGAQVVRAALKRWEVSAETRAKVVATADKLLSSDNSRVALLAARVLIAADAIDARRESIEQADSHFRQDSALAALRAALSTVAGRAALASAATTLPLPLSPPPSPE